MKRDYPPAPDPAMNNSALPYWLALAVLLAALYGGYSWYRVERYGAAGTAESLTVSLPPLDDFELQERSGQPFRSADMKGRVWVVTFFYTTCTGSCKRLNGNISHLSKDPEIADATWVSITVDPVTDTLPVLRTYADLHRADPQRWLFCRHDDFNYIKRLADDVLHVGIAFQGHRDHALIIDKQGQIAGMFNATSTLESKMGVGIIKKCLAQEYRPPAADAAPQPEAAPPADRPLPAEPTAEAA